jgi:hypothetical protein
MMATTEWVAEEPRFTDLGDTPISDDCRGLGSTTKC